MPVSETDVRPAFVAAVEHVVEQTQLWLGRQASTFNSSVHGEIVTGRDDRPVPPYLHRDWTVQRTNLSNR